MRIFIEDRDNSIRYSLGNASLEYYFLFFVRLAEALAEGNGDCRRLRIRRPIDFIFRHTLLTPEKMESMTFLDFLNFVFGIKTILISVDAGAAIESFRTFRTSYFFEYMYRTGFALMEHTDVLGICRYNDTVRNARLPMKIDSPPHRAYVADVVEYYKLALSSGDAYIQYISYYHVIEYFYDEVFKRKLIERIRNRITHPGFSYRDDEQVYRIAKDIKDRIRKNVESGQGNEIESLHYVIEEYVDIDELKDRIRELDATLIEYYQQHKVTFCGAPGIAWRDEGGIVKSLAKRIYSIRNSLVHSKSGQNDNRYRPYTDERELRKEISLIQAVAEQIIIRSSKEL